MTKQEQINRLQSRIERIENELGLVHPDYFAMPIKSNLSEIPNSCEHLLPEGYEFCAEGEAEKWVKVQNLGLYGEAKLGYVQNSLIKLVNGRKQSYRPIRPIQYHVAVHEAVTTEPNPYAVDWSNAPEKADSHAFDKNGNGYWYTVEPSDYAWVMGYNKSDFTLPAGLDWTKSKTTRP
jgi:hypothetical protein